MDGLDPRVSKFFTDLEDLVRDAPEVIFHVTIDRARNSANEPIWLVSAQEEGFGLGSPCVAEGRTLGDAMGELSKHWGE